MDFLSGIFVGVAFWPIACALLWCIALMVCAEQQRGYLGLMSTAIFFVLMHFVADFNVLSYIYTHPIKLVSYVAVYLILGMLYSAVRFDRYIAAWRTEYDNVIRAERKEHSFENRPTANNSKSRIIHWMAYWPWSGLWWLLSDFLTELFSFLYRRMGRLYEYIEKRHQPVAPPRVNERPHGGGGSAA